MKTQKGDLYKCKCANASCRNICLFISLETKENTDSGYIHIHAGLIPVNVKDSSDMKVCSMNAKDGMYLLYRDDIPLSVAMPQ